MCFEICCPILTSNLLIVRKLPDINNHNKQFQRLLI